jgi:hypothetical protein
MFTHHTEETKKRIGNSQRGKISKLRGTTQTNEHKLKNSLANKGKIPWNKGKHYTKKSRAIEQFLNNIVPTTSSYLKWRLFKEGLKEKKCEKCKLTTWQEQESVFELHHRNNNHNDNTLENLEILCPNCHAIETRNNRKRIRV